MDNKNSECNMRENLFIKKLHHQLSKGKYYVSCIFVNYILLLSIFLYFGNLHELFSLARFTGECFPAKQRKV